MPNPTSISFLTLSEYIEIATKLLCGIKREHKLCSHELSEILKSEDSFSYFVEALVYADWSFNSNGTLEGYRKQCVLWAIGRWRLQKKRMVHKDHKSLDYGTKNRRLIDRVARSINSKNTALAERVHFILRNTVMSKKQRLFIKLHYFEDMTLQKIAKKFSCSKQNVDQEIKRGIRKMQQFAGVKKNAA